MCQNVNAFDFSSTFFKRLDASAESFGVGWCLFVSASLIKLRAVSPVNTGMDLIDIAIVVRFNLLQR